MGNLNLQSKQFRGKRTRAGKLIRNRIGGYKFFSCCDDGYDMRRRKLLLAALNAEESQSTDEVLCCNESVCCLTGEPIPAGGGLVVEEGDMFGEQNLLVVRYGADGKLLSAHTLSADEAYDLRYPLGS